MSRISLYRAFLGSFFLAVFWQTPASPASHQWRFNEVFRSDDGTIQFIEMKECCGFTQEHGLQGKWILAVGANTQFDFRSDLTGDTAGKHLLLATQAFADLPGMPAPDFIIPAGFLPLGGDILEYWTYTNATWSYSALPLDGISSVNEDGSTGINSPTNYAGESGSLDLTPVLRSTWGRLKGRRLY